MPHLSYSEYIMHSGADYNHNGLPNDVSNEQEPIRARCSGHVIHVSYSKQSVSHVIRTQNGCSPESNKV